jgi:HlyD family secretion protein
MLNGTVIGLSCLTMDRILDKKIWTLKRIVTVSSIASFILFILFFLVLNDTSTKLNVEKERITLYKLRRAPFQEFIPISGSVEPFQTVYLDLTEGGRVIEKYIQEGAFVKAGDPIVRLDNPNLSLQVMNTQSNFMLAESQLRQTRLTFEQNSLYKENQLLDINVRLSDQKRKYDVSKMLFEKGMLARNEYESSKELYESLLKSRELMVELLKKDSLTNLQLIEQSETNVERSKSYLQLIESQLASLTVKAPINGQLTSLDAEIGQSVSLGYKLGRIDNIDSFKIRAEVDEHYIARVHEHLTGEYEFNGNTYDMIIKTVYPQVTDGKFAVDLAFIGERPDGIRRGQTVHVKLQLGDVSEALLIPTGGFYASTGGQWIFVVDQSEKSAVRRPIKIGRQNPQYYEVLEGLRAGEKVVTSSYDNYGDIEKLILQ